MTVFVPEYIVLVVVLVLFGCQLWKEGIKKTSRDAAEGRKN